MRLTLHQIETFYWVARLKSFHAAARHQHLTQPSVSSRVAELEDLVGYKLFERSPQGAELTPRARRLLSIAEEMLGLADEFAGDTTLPMRGVLRLGSNESAAMAGLSDFLTFLKSDYPGLKVELTVDIGAELRTKLNNGALDFVILTNPATSSQTVDVLLGHSPMSWVAATGWNENGEPLSSSEMCMRPVITIPSPSSLNASTLSWLTQENANLTPTVTTCNSLSIVLRLVQAGLGAAVLPPAIMEREMQDGLVELLPVTQPVAPLPIYASFPRGRREVDLRRIANLARTALEGAGLIE